MITVSLAANVRFDQQLALKAIALTLWLLVLATRACPENGLRYFNNSIRFRAPNDQLARRLRNDRRRYEVQYDCASNDVIFRMSQIMVSLPWTNAGVIVLTCGAQSPSCTGHPIRQFLSRWLWKKSYFYFYRKKSNALLAIDEKRLIRDLSNAQSGDNDSWIRPRMYRNRNTESQTIGKLRRRECRVMFL